MVFKRRTPRTWLQWIAAGFWPRGGWSRAFYYVVHRLRRLPDPPHRIARGIAAGVFVSFSPFFGLHFIAAAGVAVILQGNILAALMATFAGNPFTFPFMAAVAIELGQWILGLEDTIPLQRVFGSFAQASSELWHNAMTPFTGEKARWDRLAWFWANVFLPYLVGGIIPGLVAGAASYMLALPAVKAYQARRVKRLRGRYEKRRAALAKANQKGAGGGASSPPL
ncbi:MAG: DUF2062 domain-containing protein [Pseudomonadota bacterium]